MTRLRFIGHIAGVGSTQGTRIVLGHWVDTPMGVFSDAMVARSDGRRILLAPSEEVADFIAATYTFDETRIETFTAGPDESGRRWQVRSDSLELDFVVGRRSWLGVLLRAVPGAVARSPLWCALTDPIARVVLRGVRTKGETRDGRREWYGATDNRIITSLSGSFEGGPLGELAAVSPPPRFGFSSTPPAPSLTAVCTTVDVPARGQTPLH